MLLTIKKLFFTLSLNSILFLILLIGIQNSSKKSQVNLIIDETVSLPISFIVGSSFITGSILGGFLSLSLDKKKP